jgi:hypothetical protein
MPFRKSSHTNNEFWEGHHRFEHWYRDNTVYFITSKVRDGFRAFESEQAKAIFWDRFNCYAEQHGFAAWITTLLDNHYHTLGYFSDGSQLGEMMRKLHGSVAWTHSNTYLVTGDVGFPASASGSCGLINRSIACRAV